MLSHATSSARGPGRVVALLFVSLLSAVFQSSLAAPAPAAVAIDPVDLATEFLRLFASGGLSVSAATALMGDGATAQREGAYWQVRRRDGQQAIVMRAADSAKGLDDAELRLDMSAGLQLSDLAKKFGSWKVVSEGKMSSVSFRVAGAGSLSTAVFVRLLTPTATPDSPAVSLQLRREP